MNNKKWKQFLTEANQPQWHGLAFDGRNPTEEEIKLMDIFPGSGAQALELAELTGNEEMAVEFRKMLKPIREIIAKIEVTIKQIRNGTMTSERLDVVATELELDAEKVWMSSRNHEWFVAEDWFEDSLYEMKDYIWHHGMTYSGVVGLGNVASEEKSKEDLDKIKTWAGMAGQVELPLSEKKFSDFEDGPGQWTDLAVADLRNPENIDLSIELYNLIANAYSHMKPPGHFDFKTPEDIPSDHDVWAAVNIDDDPEPDALRVGKNKPSGLKLTASGHDGSREGKDAYINKTAEMLLQNGYYAEMSKGIAHLMIKYHSVPHVGEEETVRKVLGKEIEWIGPHPEGKYPGYDGWYIRDISGHRELKIMLGTPNA